MRYELLEILRASARKFYDYTCANCGVTGDNVQLDHIFPVCIWQSRMFDPGNVQLLCPDCNRIKGTDVRDFRSEDYKSDASQLEFRNEFLSDVSRVIEHQKQLLTIARRITDETRRAG